MKRQRDNNYEEKIKLAKKIKDCLTTCGVVPKIQLSDNSIISDDGKQIADSHYTMSDGKQLVSHATGYEDVEMLHAAIRPPYHMQFHPHETQIVQDEHSIVYDGEEVVSKTYDNVLARYKDERSVDNFHRATHVNVLNNIVINNITEVESVPTVDLVKSLGEEFLTNYLFCHDRGAFKCINTANIWKKIKLAQIAEELYNICCERIVPTKKIKKYLGKFHEKDFSLAAKAILAPRSTFDLELDKDIFPMNEFHLDKGVMKQNNKGDYIFVSTNWVYNEHDAEKYMDELQLFLRKLFPDDQERRLMLKFCASLLHGNRTEKCFIVLTDDRGGNNGKSTWINFLCGFFGQMTYNNTRLFLNSAIPDKNGQDGILYKAFNKRLIVGSEFKSTMKLDVSLMKKLTGIDPISGRHFGKDDDFCFTSQAGVILVYNEGDGPSEDLGDEAFQSRKIVFRMKSKFIRGAIEDNWETLTFQKKKIEFSHYYSSFLKLLIPLSTNDWLEGEIITNDMADAKATDSPLQLQIYESIERLTVYTGNKKDYVQLRQLFDNAKIKHCELKEFLAIAKEYMSKNGDYRKVFRPVVNNVQLYCTNVIFGYKTKIFLSFL